ncbi:tRNA lysidine(34) synthetase TilS [Thalassotalea atypica]|uniref:tRNA lysidine(34) synthetase TilS n=1 Tax=Thalassotalea atypica TaxID=2054316 RepID=UPI0025730A98|nr:tRNA lysidine(34) synthetase TilS [Thalassotalea atypica]
MSKLNSSILNIIAEYPTLPIAVAYSGGLDSQVLLDVVCKLKTEHSFPNTIYVCHVNHGLSEFAQDWSEFAKSQCQFKKVSFKPLKVTLDKSSKESLEAQAREARYKAICSISSAPMLILTGHHKDDQAETFLLALKRGAGVKGLGAMSLISSLEQHVLARPLLSFTRAELQQYADNYQLRWVEDESNLDTVFDRNFIRQDIMPRLKERWPGIVDTINRSAEHCQQTQSLLDDMALLDLTQCENSDGSALLIPSMLQLSTARFNNLIRYFLMKHGVQMPSTVQLAEVAVQINAQADKKPQVKVGDHWLRRFKDQLFLTTAFEDVSEFSVEVQLADLLKQGQLLSVILPDGLGEIVASASDEELLIEKSRIKSVQKVKISTEDKMLLVAFKHENPFVLPSYRQHRRPLKKILQELNMPVWLRKRTPLIYIDGELAAVVDQFICQSFLPQEKQKAFYIYWLNAD